MLWIARCTSWLLQFYQNMHSGKEDKTSMHSKVTHMTKSNTYDKNTHVTHMIYLLYIRKVKMPNNGNSEGTESTYRQGKSIKSMP